MQQAKLIPPHDSGFSLFGCRTRAIEVRGGDRIDSWVVLPNTRDTGIHEFDRRDLFGADQATQF